MDTAKTIFEFVIIPIIIGLLAKYAVPVAKEYVRKMKRDRLKDFASWSVKYIEHRMPLAESKTKYTCAMARAKELCQKEGLPIDIEKLDTMIENIVFECNTTGLFSRFKKNKQAPATTTLPAPELENIEVVSPDENKTENEETTEDDGKNGHAL